MRAIEYRRSATSAVTARLATIGTAAIVFALASSVTAQPPASADDCRLGGAVVPLAEVPEASGLAASRTVPGRLWALNDSGEPALFALNTRGEMTARVRLSGAAVEDWEALAVGPCPAGSCVYIGDIGDNRASRKRVTVYRVPEPEAGAQSAAVADVFHAAYPDGAHDAETLLLTPDGTLIIVTKGETGPIALYRFPHDLRPGATAGLERIAAAGETKPKPGARITDGSVSPDGRWTALRTGSDLAFFRTADLLAGQWREVRRLALAPLKEPQGEAVALGAADTVFVAGEGGGKSQPGTFAHFACAPGR